MTEQKEPTSWTTTAMLFPSFAHRFLVRFGGPKDLADILTAQVRNCQFDFVEKTFDLEISQPLLDGGVAEEIARIMQSTSSPHISVDICDGSMPVVGSIRRIEFVELKPISHKLSFDYAANTETIHRMKFSFYDIEVDIAEYESNY